VPEEKNGEVELKARRARDSDRLLPRPPAGRAARPSGPATIFKTEILPARLLFHKKDKELDQ
jgi:hypothetical protein